MLTLQVIVEQNTQLSAITVDIQSRVEKLDLGQMAVLIRVSGSLLENIKNVCGDVRFVLKL